MPSIFYMMAGNVEVDINRKSQSLNPVISDHPHHHKGFKNVWLIIPEFPLWLATGLCITNILFPGVGTIIAGFSVLRLGNPRQRHKHRIGHCCLNIEIGFVQLFLSVVLIGWIWSIVWGFLFVAVSDIASPPEKPALFKVPVVEEEISQSHNIGNFAPNKKQINTAVYDKKENEEWHSLQEDNDIPKNHPEQFINEGKKRKPKKRNSKPDDYKKESIKSKKKKKLKKSRV